MKRMRDRTAREMIDELRDLGEKVAYQYQDLCFEAARWIEHSMDYQLNIDNISRETEKSINELIGEETKSWKGEEETIWELASVFGAEAAKGYCAMNAWKCRKQAAEGVRTMGKMTKQYMSALKDIG